MARSDDLIDTITRLRREVDELKSMGATRWGGGPWVPWPAWDLNFAIAGYVTGNAIHYMEYRLDGDMCDFRFHYTVGTTSGFPAHYLRFPLPFAQFDNGNPPANARLAVGTAQANDTSRGLAANAVLYNGASDGALCYAFGLPTVYVGGASTHNYWNQFTPSFPFATPGTGAAEAWAINDVISGSGRYRIAS